MDKNGQTPLYYAIKSSRIEVLEYLLSLGINLNNQDKKGSTPINFAVRYNKQHIKDMLIKAGATPPPDTKSKKFNKKQQQPVFAPEKKKVNDKMIPKDFVLQILENGTYRPITEEEFDLLK